MVVDVPDATKDINHGKEIVPYHCPCPIVGTGLHRYVTLIFEQRQLLSMSMSVDATYESILMDLSTSRRSDFDLKEIVDGLNLIAPLCINGCYAEWDSHCEGVIPKLCGIDEDNGRNDDDAYDDNDGDDDIDDNDDDKYNCCTTELTIITILRE